MHIGNRSFLSVFRRTSIGMPSMSGAAEAGAWRDAVVTNGGTVSAGRLAIVSTFIAAEKAAGTWTLTDDYWGLWAENAPQALTSLKQRRLATVTAAPTFVVDRHYLFNGTTNYIDTGFVLSTHAVALSGTNQRLAVYVRNETSLNLYTAGVINAVNTSAMGIMARNATAMHAMLNGPGQNVTLAVASSLGFAAISRANGTTTISGYKNGSALTPAATTAPGTTLPPLSLYIGARNLTGAPSGNRADAVGFLCIGAPLSDTQEAAQYANVQAWATAVGANV